HLAELWFGVVRKNIFPRCQKTLDLGVTLRYKLDYGAVGNTAQKVSDSCNRNIIRYSKMVDQCQGQYDVHTAAGDRPLHKGVALPVRPSASGAGVGQIHQEREDGGSPFLLAAAVVDLDGGRVAIPGDDLLGAFGGDVAERASIGAEVPDPLLSGR